MLYLQWKCKYQGPEKFEISFFKKGKSVSHGFLFPIKLYFIKELETPKEYKNPCGAFLRYG